MTSPAWLELQGIRKTYGRATVLHELDLTLQKQEFVCLLGPSGCGKTTLLRILCGIEVCDSGRVLLQGEDITRLPPSKRHFGVVFQSYALFPNLSALNNVAYGLHGMVRRQRYERAMEMLELVGLSDHASKFPAQLSGGQQQRVALARALAPEPRLLLLDEPLSALDAQVRQTLRSEIRCIQQTLGIAAIMVTHDQDEALGMADRVVLMDAGSIVQEADPVSLYTRPCNDFAARFIGRINLLPVHFEPSGHARIGAASLTWQSTPDFAPDRHATGSLAIRPSHLIVHRPPLQAINPITDLPENHFPARILSLTFSGAWLSLRLNVPNFGTEAPELEAELATPPDGVLTWQAGDACIVELPAQALYPIPQS